LSPSHGFRFLIGREPCGGSSVDDEKTGDTMAQDPFEPVPNPIPPVPPPASPIPPIDEPEPDRLPGEAPLPNPDENDQPPKYA
jgi:hypothetical protein